MKQGSPSEKQRIAGSEPRHRRQEESIFGGGGGGGGGGGVERWCGSA